MPKKYKSPVAISLYLGSGKTGEKLRENIQKESGKESVSEFIVQALREARPSVFKGVIENGK